MIRLLKFLLWAHISSLLYWNITTIYSFSISVSIEPGVPGDPPMIQHRSFHGAQASIWRIWFVIIKDTINSVLDTLFYRPGDHAAGSDNLLGFLIKWVTYTNWNFIKCTSAYIRFFYSLKNHIQDVYISYPQ